MSGRTQDLADSLSLLRRGNSNSGSGEQECAARLFLAEKLRIVEATLAPAPPVTRVAQAIEIWARYGKPG